MKSCTDTKYSSESLLPSIHHHFAWVGWWPARISPSAKTVQSNGLEEVVCWYDEKNPSDPKIVQRASVYGSQEINSSANLTPNKPKRPVYLGHSYTHVQGTEGWQLSSGFRLCQSRSSGRVIPLGSGRRGDTPPHMASERESQCVRGLHIFPWGRWALDRSWNASVRSFLDATDGSEANLEPVAQGLSILEAFSWVFPQQCCPYTANNRKGHLKQLFHLSALGRNTFYNL